jgi:hypothetical protein
MKNGAKLFITAALVALAFASDGGLIIPAFACLVLLWGLDKPQNTL